VSVPVNSGPSSDPPEIFNPLPDDDGGLFIKAVGKTCNCSSKDTFIRKVRLIDASAPLPSITGTPLVINALASAMVSSGTLAYQSRDGMIAFRRWREVDQRVGGVFGLNGFGAAAISVPHPQMGVTLFIEKSADRKLAAL
jgi:hypothetical protein